MVFADRLLFSLFHDDFIKYIAATGDVELSQARPETGRVMHFMDEWQRAMFARILFLLL